MQNVRVTFRLCAALPLLAIVGLTQASDFDERQATALSDKLLAALIETNGVAGMGGAIWRDGKVVWTGSAGHRDVEKGLRVDRDTIFRLASVSKLITATAAARLKQDNAFDVDAPVESLLPYLSRQWAPLTTRQLAAHTSGLPHYQAIDLNRGSTRFATAREAVGVFRDRELLSVPGAQYRYSSWGYTLLSAVIEQRAGVPFLDYVATRITPGLAIGADATDGSNAAASRAYAFVEGKARPAAAHDFSYTWGGGGFGATPQALVEFGGRVMRGEIVSPATFSWMMMPAKLADGSVVKDADYAVGFGWRTGTDVDGERIAHHAGVTVGARSALVLWPERFFGVSLLSNTQWTSSIEQTAMMLAAPFRPAPSGLVPRTCPLDAARYEGHFGDKAIAGKVRFSLENGLCVGELALGNSFGEYLNGFPQKDATSIRMIGLDAKGGFSRAALITPIGMLDLRAQAAGGHVARLGGARSLELVFFQANPSANRNQ